MISFSEKRYCDRSLAVFFIVFLFISFSCVHDSPSTKTVRTAIDIGSGATKVKIVEFDQSSEKILNILYSQEFPIAFQEDIEKTNKISDETIRETLAIFKKINAIAQTYHSERIIGVATASFRKAENSKALAKEIKNLYGISIEVVSQDLEAKLAFNAVKAKVPDFSTSSIVWDIGGGSLQFISKNETGEYDIFRGKEASVAFKNSIVSQIKKEDYRLVRSPNPLNEKEMKEALALTPSFVTSMNFSLREKIKKANKIYVVGSLFNNNIRPIVAKSFFSYDELKDKIRPLLGKTDNQMSGGSYSNVYFSNALFVLGLMESLAIDKVEIIDVNNSDGAVLYKEFWQ